LGRPRENPADAPKKRKKTSWQFCLETLENNKKIHYSLGIMRKVSLKSISYAVLCVLTTAVLSVCVMEPVDLKKFVEDPKVVEIIDKGRENAEGVKIGITFVVNNKSPKLQFATSSTGPWNDLNNGSVTTIPSGALPLYIRVENQSDYSSSEWYCNDSTPFTNGVGGTNDSVLTAGTAIFDSPKTYNITVVGKASGDSTPYGTYVFIKVDN
jgi:hypothetical protein